MIERVLIVALLLMAALGAYQAALAYQRRRALTAANSEGSTGRSALLVFTSPTCAPCKYYQLPVIDRLMADWRDRVDVRIIDVSEQPETARQYGVWSVPTTIVLDARRNVAGLNVGVADEAKLRAQFERAALAGWG